MSDAAQISLAAVDNGKVVSATGVQAPVPWWSFTKTVIAAGALVLVRDGRLALDEPLPGRPYNLQPAAPASRGRSSHAPGEWPGGSRRLPRGLRARPARRT
jgi:hypothetical protein